MMAMNPDENLERIRERKLQELVKKAGEKKSAANKPVDLTAAALREFIKNHSIAVVDCWAPWCGPCRMVAPILEELAREYSGRITFGKLNVDENQSAAMDYQVMSIPTLLVFKNGKLVDRIIGAMPKQALESKITRQL